jgi:hypothetical protein
MTRFIGYLITGYFYYYSYALLAGFALDVNAFGIVLFVALLAFPALVPPLALYWPRVSAWTAVPFLLAILWWKSNMIIDVLTRRAPNGWQEVALFLFLLAPALVMSWSVFRTLRSPPTLKRWKWEWLRPLLAMLPPLILLIYWGWLKRWWLR